MCVACARSRRLLECKNLGGVWVLAVPVYDSGSMPLTVSGTHAHTYTDAQQKLDSEYVVYPNPNPLFLRTPTGASLLYTPLLFSLVIIYFQRVTYRLHQRAGTRPRPRLRASRRGKPRRGMPSHVLSFQAERHLSSLQADQETVRGKLHVESSLFLRNTGCPIQIRCFNNLYRLLQRQVHIVYKLY